MDKFTKFTSIEKFSDIWKMAQKQNIGKIQMRSKIKLHGTNAGIRIYDGTVQPQKRTEDVNILADNAGFAFWAGKVDWKTNKNVIIYGEWAGPGVQKSDAVSQIDRKRFFVFGALLSGEEYVIEPDHLAELVPDHPDIHIIPWYNESWELDSNNVETARALGAYLEAEVPKIGDEDPYIKELFGVSGAGEGLVTGPYDPSGKLPYWMFNTFVFKVKSEAHLAQKTNKLASFKVEVPGSVKDFAKMFVTPARCEQMIAENCGGSLSPKVIGDFLKAINADILKESVNELKEMNVEWKMIAREINNEALAWFKAQNTI